MTEADNFAQQSAEPVAWRWRFKEETNWTLYRSFPPLGNEADVICEPLFTRPPAATEPNEVATLVTKMWNQIYDKRPEGDPKDTYQKILAAVSVLVAQVERLTAKADQQTTALDLIYTTSGEIFDEPAENVTTLQFLRDVAEAALSHPSTMRPVCGRCEGKGYITKPHDDGGWYTADCPDCTVSSTERQNG